MDYSIYYEQWIDAVASRIRMELLKPFWIIGGVYNSLTTGEFIIYPLRGIQLFFTRWNDILPIYLSLTIPSLVIESLVQLLVFLLVYPINFALFTASCGPLGATLAISATLLESASIASQICSYLIPTEKIKQTKLNAVFDHVLCASGHEKLVIPGKLQRTVGKSAAAEAISPSRWLCWASRIVTWNLIKAVPVFGGLWISYQGLVGSMDQRMSRFAKLQRLRPRQAKYGIKAREGQFIALAVTMQLLESIPFLGQIFFSFTDHIATALVCADSLKKNP